MILDANMPFKILRAGNCTTAIAGPEMRPGSVIHPGVIGAQQLVVSSAGFWDHESFTRAESLHQCLTILKPRSKVMATEGVALVLCMLTQVNHIGLQAAMQCTS